MRIRSLALGATLGLILSLAVAGAASADDGQLHVRLDVARFHSAGSRTTAQGTVTAGLTDNGGRTTALRAPVTLAVKSGGSCKVLHLNLDTLDLVLLGLNVHLDKVVLDVTGQANGGILGSLFCRLARARIAGSSSGGAVRSLNRAVARHPLRPLAFTVRLRHQVSASQAATCPVLDLVLGPLNLNLLGLVVDLQRVHLNLTATRGGGALGDLFCQLSK